MQLLIGQHNRLQALRDLPPVFLQALIERFNRSQIQGLSLSLLDHLVGGVPEADAQIIFRNDCRLEVGG